MVMQIQFHFYKRYHTNEIKINYIHKIFSDEFILKYNLYIISYCLYKILIWYTYILLWLLLVILALCHVKYLAFLLSGRNDLVLVS